MLKGIKKYYGDFTKEEFYKFILLGLIFALIVGVMWMLMPIRDTLFCERIIGFSTCENRHTRESYFIWARVISLLALVPLTIAYGRILNRYQKETAFYIITGLYCIIFSLFFLFFFSRHFNGIPSHDYWSGWLWFICVESFNALFIATFWAFVIDTSNESQAAKGFGLIIMLGQLGGIIIPTSLQSLFKFSSSATIGCAAFMLFLSACIMSFLNATTPKKSMEGYKGIDTRERKELGLLEGLKLIYKHKYLTGIALIILFFEYVVNLFDLNFKTMVFASFPDIAGASLILSRYALAVNLITFLLLALGINNIQRIYGLRRAFITSFVCMGSALLMFYFIPTITVVMAALVIAKAVNYSLNSPSIKQLYIPTTTDVKYQSQTWVETFGVGGAKALGSLTGLGKYTLGNVLFFTLSCYGSFAILCVWIIIAITISSQWNRALKKNEVIC